MNYKKLFLLALGLCASSSVYAHCPSNIKEEKVCMMLDGNLVYIYDEKLEHNGPYKDLAKASVKGFKDEKGQAVKFTRVARGIYKLEANERLGAVMMTVQIEKKEKDIKIKHE